MTVKRITFLQALLDFIGLGGRLHLAWISSAEAQKFVQVVTDFTKKIKSLGPNPLVGAPDSVATWLSAAPPLENRPHSPNTQLKPAHSAGMAEEATHENKSETVA